MAGPRRLAVVNMKGGVGKTTTAVTLAAGFARAGHRVLLIDADPQGNASHYLEVPGERTIRDVMLGTVAVSDAVARDVRSGLDVLPASPAAFALDAQLAGTVQRETILHRRLSGVDGYHAIVVDCSPAMNLLAYNALLASESLIVPIGMDAHAILGARHTLDGVCQIRALWPDRRLTLAAVVPVAVNMQTHASRATIAALQADQELGSALFTPGIRQCIDLVYAAAAHQTIWEYAPTSRAAEDYGALLRWLDRDPTSHRMPHGQDSQTSSVL
jgi:chromosome partitioning protein